MMISAKVCFLGQKICQRIAGKAITRGCKISKLNDSTDYGAFTSKKFTETFFKIEVISDCRYIVKDTDVKTDKEIVHRYQTQEDAWNAAMLCANRQTFDLSVKIPGSVHMSVNYKEQTISVIGSDNQLKRLYKVTTDANQS